jgi:serine/threonine protein phosphatase PrpC
VNRHISTDLSSISYSGYLLKRSNQPYPQSQRTATYPIDPDHVPELPIMSGMFAAKKLESHWPSDLDSPSEPSATVPLHSSLISPSPSQLQPPPNEQLAPVHEPPSNREEKNPIQLGLDAAAAFFGLSLGGKETQQQTPAKNERRNDTKPPAPILIQPKKKASAPIKVGNGSSLNHQAPTDQQLRDSFQESLHRTHSAPVLLTPNSDSDADLNSQSRSPPQDFVDQKDGHIWRAKYCVLEEGALYFYRNTTDGESAEAIRERRQASSGMRGQLTNQAHASTNIKDLSKSPMARSLYHHLDSNGSGESSGCMWEKRVFLDSVGAVRSAEQEYGPNSFELQGINDNGDIDHVDTLVLQARDPSDMKEWIFQFHRSLASFMRNIMDVVGSSGAYLDIDYPALSHQPSRIIHNSGSEKQLQRMLSMSPKLSQTPPVPHSLSHGHGRITVHRRRPDVTRNKITRPVSDNAMSSLSSTPETGGSGSPLMFAMREPSPGSSMFRMSLADSPPDRFLLPPSNKSEPQPSELCGPQSDYPEPERPKPATPVKYVPPQLKNKQQPGDGPPKIKYVPPQLRKKQEENGSKRYVPPQLRDGGQSGQEASLQSLAELAAAAPETPMEGTQPTHLPDPSQSQFGTNGVSNPLDVVGEHTLPFKRGGCANPQLVDGSILDSVYIPRKASKLSQGPSEAFGSYGGGALGEGPNGAGSSLRWETGAVSECGIRDSNEDAYLITHDLLDAFRSLPQHTVDSRSPWTKEEAQHNLGLFAVFDGHCGNEAARYAAEKLPYFIYDELISQLPTDGESTKMEHGMSPFHPKNVEDVLRAAVTKLDDEFCRFCQEGGREWESGATALVAVIVNGHLVIANLGDCRGVLCRVVEDRDSDLADDVWNELDTVVDDFGQRSIGDEHGELQRCVWKEVTSIHSPCDEDENRRIVQANGWVTTETEIPIGQLHRMDFLDEDVIGILKRCFSDRYENSGRTVKECKAAPQRILQISRVCGELAVSRALGDRDFKAAFNTESPAGPMDIDHNQWWDCPLFLPYPDLHRRQFQGDLVSNSPDFQTIRVGEESVSDEFLLLACDGLWDVMDADDAVRVTRDLLFRKKWTAKRAVRKGRGFPIVRCKHGSHLL